MKNIFVVRHGETDFNKDGKYLGRIDESLNCSGITQAKELAVFLKDLNIEIIYCSPLKRAIETANFIKSQLNCGIIVDESFIERSLGIYEGLTKNEIKYKYPDLFNKNITRIFDNAPPEGEIINQVIERVFNGLQKINDEKRYSNILIVTHGFVAKAINKFFNEKITEEEFFNFNLKNAEIIKYRFN